MHQDDADRTKTDPKRRDFLILSLACIAACAIVRAPSVLDEITVPLIDLKLKLNAGYVLVFGPLLIMLAILAIHFLREDIPRTRGKKDLKNGLFRAIPPLGAAFLSKSIHFPPIAYSKFVRPVTFLIGRDRDGVMPSPTGSAVFTKRIGIVAVSLIKAATTGGLALSERSRSG